jgi:multidrug efflux system membrane fusion protein
VLFNLPQQELPQLNSAAAKGPLAVEAQRSDTDAVIDRGLLRVVDNQVDQTTGTVKLKAEFPNPDLQLWPGQFVNIRLLIDTLKQVVVIPTGAVQRGPNGTFVYIVKDDSTVAVRSITVQKQDETQTVVKNGLEPDERVVTTGFVRLTDGSKVSIASANAPPGQPERTQSRGGQKRQRGSNAPPPSAPQ